MLDTMDDASRTLKIKINGTEYPAAPFGETQVMALQMLRNVQGATIINILGGLVKFSLGEEVRDEVLVLLASGELELEALIAMLKDIVTAQAEAKKATEAVALNVPETFTGGRD